MYRFKDEHKNVQIVLRRAGLVVTSKNLTDSIARLIIEQYPQYAHNLEEVDGKRAEAQPFRISVPELEKKKDTLSISQPQPTAGENLSAKEEKPQSPSQESKRRRGRPKAS